MEHDQSSEIILPTDDMTLIRQFETLLGVEQFFTEYSTKFARTNFLMPGKNEINRRVSCTLHQIFKQELFRDLCWKKGSAYLHIKFYEFLIFFLSRSHSDLGISKFNKTYSKCSWSTKFSNFYERTSHDIAKNAEAF